MTDQGFTVRALSANDFDRFYDIIDAAFLQVSPRETREARRRMFVKRTSSFHGVFDGGRLVGTGGMPVRRLTVPGPTRIPVCAVTTIAVGLGDRGRGVLRALMRHQFDEMRRQDIGVAVLNATEAGIYGRFGYGLSSDRGEFLIPHKAAFRPGVDFGTDRVRDVTRNDAANPMRELYARAARERIGWLSRDEPDWMDVLLDDEFTRDDSSPMRFALHPDGFARFRTDGGWTDRSTPNWELDLLELCAVTPTAYAALWRYLLNISLVREISYDLAAADEALIHLLADPRVVSRRMMDMMFTRVVDIEKALPVRRYAADLRTVLAVTDSFCPWNAGVWRLEIIDGRAHVERCAERPEVELDVVDLGAIYLGGTTLTTLACAGRVNELREGAIAAIARSFAATMAPHCPEVF